jgi:hypothetical protein
VALNLAHRHAARVKAQNLLIKAVKARLSFGDQLRFEAPSAIARHRNLDLAILGQNRLRAGPVAAVTGPAPGRIAFLITEVLAQFGPERALNQGLL